MPSSIFCWEGQTRAFLLDCALTMALNWPARWGSGSYCLAKPRDLARRMVAPLSLCATIRTSELQTSVTPELRESDLLRACKAE